MLQIKNVNLNVGNTALLSNINLTLEQGKNYGVLGPNGAGKTTLFKSMLGLTDFSGEILSDGQPVSSRVVLCQEKVQIKYNQFSLFM